MVKLVTTIVPENGMRFEDIACFHTMHYIGIWNNVANRFALFEKSGTDFYLSHLPPCKSLEEVEEAVYKECEEHIIGVSDRATYEFTLTED